MLNLTRADKYLMQLHRTRLFSGFCRQSRRSLTSITTNPSRTFPTGFDFWPEYFSPSEQKTLLRASLLKLDSCESRLQRKRRREYWKSNLASPKSVSDIFAPDELYAFEEGHYDGVIHHYREMHLASWPVDEIQELEPTLKRLHSLCDTKDIQTHLLHLASYGDILPHVDNASASGSWILGISLGAERRLRMRETNSTGDLREFAVSLPSGSVYLQRDNVRFNYEHSIERDQEEGQRLSIMIRDCNKGAATLS